MSGANRHGAGPALDGPLHPEEALRPHDAAVSSGLIALTFVGVLLGAFSLPPWACTSAGVVAFLVSVGLQQRYQLRQWQRLVQDLPVHFPSQPRA